MNKTVVVSVCILAIAAIVCLIVYTNATRYVTENVGDGKIYRMDRRTGKVVLIKGAREIAVHAMEDGEIAETSGEVALFTEAQRLQEQSQFQQAVQKYEQFIQLYSKSPLCAQSQFMIGYIYANHIKDYDAAREAYQLYLEKYPNDEMVNDARWELEHLGQFP